MEVHDALYFALIGVGRRDQQAPAQSGGDGCQSQAAKYTFATFYRICGLRHG
jgi:hypothetical protein